MNARIDPKLKMQAEKVLTKIGLSASELVTLLYRQVVLQKGVPFDVKIPNEATKRAIADSRAGRTRSVRSIAELREILES